MSYDDPYLKLHVSAKQAYYLRTVCNPALPPFIRIWKNDLNSSPFFVPAAPKVEYLIRSGDRDADLYVLRQEVMAKTFRRSRPTDLVKLVRLFRFHSFNRFEGEEGLTVLPLLHSSGRAGIDTAREIRKLTTRKGWRISASFLQTILASAVFDHTEKAIPSAPDEGIVAGIVVHLHYTDLWTDFEARLRPLSVPFKLIVTLTEKNSGLVNRITSEFPDAKILVYPNRGRDVGPFVQLWRDGHLDDLSLICKLHGKKSIAAGTIFGDIWRRSMLNDLIGSDTQVRNIIQRFAEQPRLGLVGPARFRVPHGVFWSWRRSPENEINKNIWGGNDELTLAVTAKLGIPAGQYCMNYFGGTMFWIRRELLDVLKPLNLSQNDFPEEAGQAGDTLQHVLEGLFGALPGLAQPPMTIEGVTLR